MGHVGSKTRSLGQMLEKHCVRSRGYILCPIIMKLGQNVCFDKPCVCSRGYILCLIIMKLGQNVCLDKISDEFENGSCQVKN